MLFRFYYFVTSFAKKMRSVNQYPELWKLRDEMDPATHFNPFGNRSNRLFPSS